MTENQEYWQNFDETFFKDGYNLCDFFLSNGLTKENLLSAQKQLYKTIDELNDAFLKRTSAEGNPSECKMGCAYCCHQTVLATPYELLYLADFLKKKYPVATVSAMEAKAEEKALATRVLKIEKLLKHKQPCPLLHSTGGFCRAYQARPMACRIYLSQSVKSCKDDLDNPHNDSIFPQLFEMPLRAGRMMNEGFQARIRKGRETNLQAFECTIEQGLLNALEPNAFENWVRGEKVFKEIKG